MRIDFLKFSYDAIFRTKGSPDAAGYELYSTKEVIVSPPGVRIIPTLRFLKTILARFIPGPVLPCSLQMPIVESLIATTEVRSPLYFSTFRADILR